MFNILGKLCLPCRHIGTVVTISRHAAVDEITHHALMSAYLQFKSLWVCVMMMMNRSLPSIWDFIAPIKIFKLPQHDFADCKFLLSRL